MNSEKSPFRPYARVRSFDDLDPDLAIYRQRTIHFLRRYFQMSMEVGRVPSLLGREVFRTRVTSYRMGTFEDTVIFVHDIERCLERLDPESQSLIVRIVFQDYTQEEAAGIFGCTVANLVEALSGSDRSNDTDSDRLRTAKTDRQHQESRQARASGQFELIPGRDRCVQRRRVPEPNSQYVRLCQRLSLASCLPHSWPIRARMGPFYVLDTLIAARHFSCQEAILAIFSVSDCCNSKYKFPESV